MSITYTHPTIPPPIHSSIHPTTLLPPIRPPIHIQP